MSLHDPFKYLKHQLWPKEGLGVKLPIWLSTITSQESPLFTYVRWHTTYHWKEFEEGYNFALDFTLIGGLHKKLWPSKVPRVPISGVKLFILMILSIIKRWSRFVPWYYFLPFYMLSHFSFSYIRASEFCYCIKFDDSNTTLCRSLNFRFLHLNSSCESTFSI
jgi:hypothetical protein